ncbi:hypothetical protein Naga_100004g180 [Nannochloropsis gaditana]|uniref:Uncharacterized protein n=1 Tax=Nannochloropsis gaditana TaxID=72520 RepID=W7TQF7_9STRA|nr:hypothetical protein Naga_100004g180 [Nannochloropsis gaditana]
MRAFTSIFHCREHKSTKAYFYQTWEARMHDPSRTRLCSGLCSDGLMLVSIPPKTTLGQSLGLAISRRRTKSCKGSSCASIKVSRRRAASFKPLPAVSWNAFTTRSLFSVPMLTVVGAEGSWKATGKKGVFASIFTPAANRKLPSSPSRVNCAMTFTTASLFFPSSISLSHPSVSSQHCKPAEALMRLEAFSNTTKLQASGLASSCDARSPFCYSGGLSTVRCTGILDACILKAANPVFEGISCDANGLNFHAVTGVFLDPLLELASQGTGAQERVLDVIYAFDLDTNCQRPDFHPCARPVETYMMRTVKDR